jgi:hypothetical protein
MKIYGRLWATFKADTFKARLNPMFCLKLILLLGVLNGLFASFAKQEAAPGVELKRVPEGGIQPQTAVDADGTIHLVYFKGDPAGGDLFYAHSSDGEVFSIPLRVNSVAGTAVALGNIRGARIAVGRQGHVYVAWNGSQKSAQLNSGLTPLFFTRLNAAGTAFEPERNLIHSAYGIDGGGGIAADGTGRVYVFWHAPLQGSKGEQARRVWMARSQDEGKTFAPEQIVWTEPTGVCGCCSLNAFADTKGRVYVLFRAALEIVHRDMYLLISHDGGNTFQGSDISPWNVGYCVMSTASLTTGPAGVLAAWETEKQIHFGRVQGDGKVSDSLIEGGGNEKYPSLAENRRGWTLVSWTQGMGWKRGGSLHWQLLDRSGQRIALPGAAEGVPVWSLIASYPRQNGSFVILY